MTPIKCLLLESTTQMCPDRASVCVRVAPGSMTELSGPNSVVCQCVSEAFWIEEQIAANWFLSLTCCWPFLLNMFTGVHVCDVSVSKRMSKCSERLEELQNI